MHKHKYGILDKAISQQDVQIKRTRFNQWALELLKDGLCYLQTEPS